MSFINLADLGYLVPYLVLTVAGMLVVLAEAFLKGPDRAALSGLTVAGSLASMAASILLVRQLGADERHVILGGMLVADRLSYVLAALFAATTAATAMISPAPPASCACSRRWPLRRTPVWWWRVASWWSWLSASR